MKHCIFVSKAYLVLRSKHADDNHNTLAGKPYYPIRFLGIRALFMRIKIKKNEFLLKLVFHITIDKK